MAVRKKQTELERAASTVQPRGVEITVRISSDELDRLRKAAELLNVKTSTLMRTVTMIAVDKHLKAHELREREAILDEAEDL